MSILIRHGFVATVEPQGVITDGSVYIEGDKIVQVGKTEDVEKHGRADHVIDARGKLVLPGLVNSHTHCEAPSLLKGNSVEMKGYSDFIDYLQNYKWPSCILMDNEDYRTGAMLAYLESIKGGTTLVANNYYGPRGKNTSGVGEAAEKIGIRAMLVRGYHDVPYLIPEAFMESEDDLIRAYTDLHSKWRGRADGRIKAWIGPVNLLYNKPDSIRILAEIAKKLGVGLHSHVAEVKRGCDVIAERHGKSYVEVFAEVKALGPNFQAAHSIWLTDRDIELLARSGATAVHNPASNMALTDGVSPVSKMKRSGVQVALGTDGMLSMIDSMRLAVYMQKVTTLDPFSLTSSDALEMATIQGARAYGLGDKIGSIRPGKLADIVIVNLKTPQSIPYFDPITALVFYGEASSVETVIINGNIVMQDHVVTTVREEEVLEKAQSTALKVNAALSRK